MVIRRTSTRRLAVASATALVLALGVWTAGPATAAMDSNCSLYVSDPTDDDTYVYSTSSVYCVTVYDSTVVQVGNMIQESALGVWQTRAGWVYKYQAAGYTSLSIGQKASCNGHGTDTWRGVGEGRTSDNGETITPGTPRSVTC